MLSDRDYMQPEPGGTPWVVRLPQSVLKPLMVTSAVFFVLSGMGTHRPALEAVMLHPHFIKNLELWRLLTYMFAHGSFMHLCFNMWGLFVFGRPLERALGTKRFIALYFFSGVVGGIVWLLANWSDSAAPVIGASGAVFGVMMAAAMRFPNERILLLFPPVALRLKTFVAAYALIEVFMALSAGGGRVAHIAHLGGILGGFLYMRGQRRQDESSSGLRDMVQDFFSHAAPPSPQAGSEAPPPSPQEAAIPPTPEFPSLTREVDRILDKIGKSGLNSLTPQERQTLEQARRHFREKR